MKDQAYPWDSYAQLQAALMSNPLIDSHSWGIEAALNSILQSGPNSVSSTPEGIARNCGTAARRERARSVIRKRHYAELSADHTVDPVAMLDAQRSLRQIEKSVSAGQWAFIQAIGEGATCADMSLAEERTIGSIRVRLCRLRKQLGNLLDAA
jgi:hypothetical protein